MYLYNVKSAMSCKTEEERNQHEMEISDFFAKLDTLHDYDCAILRKYQDSYHEDIPQRVIPSSLSQIVDDLQAEDMKNGMDIVVDDEYFVIVVYGSGYITSDDKYGINTVALKILPYNSDRVFLDITQTIISGKNTLVATNQFEKESSILC